MGFHGPLYWKKCHSLSQTHIPSCWWKVSASCYSIKFGNTTCRYSLTSRHPFKLESHCILDNKVVLTTTPLYPSTSYMPCFGQGPLTTHAQIVPACHVAENHHKTWCHKCAWWSWLPNTKNANKTKRLMCCIISFHCCKSCAWPQACLFNTG